MFSYCGQVKEKIMFVSIMEFVDLPHYRKFHKMKSLDEL